jgi:hypothetical protein
MFVVGRFIAVGMTWGNEVSWLLPGFGISAKAMLDGVGVAGVAQLEAISAQMSTTTECRIMYFNLCLNIKLQIHVEIYLRAIYCKLYSLARER